MEMQWQSDRERERYRHAIEKRDRWHDDGECNGGESDRERTGEIERRSSTESVYTLNSSFLYTVFFLQWITRKLKEEGTATTTTADNSVIFLWKKKKH